jgi:hypothetical protein
MAVTPDSSRIKLERTVRKRVLLELRQTIVHKLHRSV